LRDIDARHRSLPLRERFRQRNRVGLRQVWRVSGSIHPGRKWPYNTPAGLVVRVARATWYLGVGVPPNQIRKSKRLAKGPWLDPPI